MTDATSDTLILIRDMEYEPIVAPSKKGWTAWVKGYAVQEQQGETPAHAVAKLMTAIEAGEIRKPAGRKKAKGKA